MKPTDRPGFGGSDGGEIVLRFIKECPSLSIAVVGGLALVLRVLPLLRPGISWALVIPEDPGEYIRLAEGLRHGCGFAQWVNSSCTAPELKRTPGYPLFLIAAGGLRRSVLAAGVLGAFVCILLGESVRATWGLSAGLAAAVLLAVDLSSVEYSAAIMSDSLFESVIALAVLTELRALTRGNSDRRVFGLSIVSAVLSGFGIMIRPIGQFLPFLMPLPFLAKPYANWQRKAALALIAAIVPTIFVAGWTLRNQRLTGVRTFSRIGDYNLLFYRAAGVMAEQTGRGFDTTFTTIHKGMAGDSSPAVGTQAKPAALERQEVETAARIIETAPGTFALMTFKSAVYLLLVPERPVHLILGWGVHGTSVGRYRLEGALGELKSHPKAVILTVFQQEMGESFVVLLLMVLHFGLIVFLWIGAFRALRRYVGVSREATLWVLFPLAIALTLIALSSGPEASPRLRAPAMPFLAMLGAIGWFGRAAPNEL